MFFSHIDGHMMVVKIALIIDSTKKIDNSEKIYFCVLYVIYLYFLFALHIFVLKLLKKVKEKKYVAVRVVQSARAR